MPRLILVFAIGLVAGAAGFHGYYRQLDAPARCGWDHPFDDAAAARCRAAGGGDGYAPEARHALDRLIDRVDPE